MYYIFNWLHIVISLLANVFFWKKTQILVILQMFRPFPTTLLWPVFSITMFCLSPSAQASYLCGSSALLWLMMLSGTGFIASSGTACSNVVLLAHVEGFWSCSSKGTRPAGQKEHLIPTAPWSPKSARFRHLLSFCWRLIVCAFLLVFQGELSHHCVLPRVSLEISLLGRDVSWTQRLPWGLWGWKCWGRCCPHLGGWWHLWCLQGGLVQCWLGLPSLAPVCAVCLERWPPSLMAPSTPSLLWPGPARCVQMWSAQLG